jgi:hypothetical protein
MYNKAVYNWEEHNDCIWFCSNYSLSSVAGAVANAEEDGVDAHVNCRRVSQRH